jgi:transporter family protein
MALFGALCWGIAPLFGKIGLRGIGVSGGLIARTIITFLFVMGLTFHKPGISIWTIPAKNWLFLAIEAFLATFAGDLAYYFAIKHGDTGKMSLVLATSPLITIAAGWLFLGERLASLHIIGAALVIIGLVLINF